MLLYVHVVAHVHLLVYMYAQLARGTSTLYHIHASGYRHTALSRYYLPLAFPQYTSSIYTGSRSISVMDLLSVSTLHVSSPSVIGKL